MKQQTALAVRILNFVAPYLPAHILEEAKNIIQNTGKTWSDTERLVVGDILKHLETEGCFRVAPRLEGNLRAGRNKTH